MQLHNNPCPSLFPYRNPAAFLLIARSAKILQHQVLADSIRQRIRNDSDLVVTVRLIKFERFYIEIADRQRCFSSSILAAHLLELLQKPCSYALPSEFLFYTQERQIMVLIRKAIPADDHESGSFPF